MAHNIHTKARAIAELLLGAQPRDVAAATHVPERTVRRWRGVALNLMQASLSAEASAQIAELCALWPALSQNGRSAWARTCGALTRSGDLCLNPPVRGKSRCRMHGGRNPIATDNSHV